MGFFRDLENTNLIDKDQKITKDVWMSIAEETLLFYKEDFRTQAERIESFRDKFEKQYKDAARSFLIAVDEQVFELPYEHNNLLWPRVENLFIDILIRDTALCIYVLNLNSKTHRKMLRLKKSLRRLDGR